MHKISDKELGELKIKQAKLKCKIAELELLIEEMSMNNKPKEQINTVKAYKYIFIDYLADIANVIGDIMFARSYTDLLKKDKNTILDNDITKKLETILKEDLITVKTQYNTNDYLKTEKDINEKNNTKIKDDTKLSAQGLSANEPASAVSRTRNGLSVSEPQSGASRALNGLNKNNTDIVKDNVKEEDDKIEIARSFRITK